MQFEVKKVTTKHFSIFQFFFLNFLFKPIQLLNLLGYRAYIHTYIHTWPPLAAALINDYFVMCIMVFQV